jgi:hypothetical protein
MTFELHFFEQLLGTNPKQVSQNFPKSRNANTGTKIDH